MRRECRERFFRHHLQRKPRVSDPGMHHHTCVTARAVMHFGIAYPGGGENVPGIPGRYATRNFIYLARGPWLSTYLAESSYVDVIFVQDRRWNADKPSAALDPYIPT